VLNLHLARAYLTARDPAFLQSLLESFFDTQGDQVRLPVTGSSRLDVFRRSDDSLAIP
jgi:hypothetical protein